MAKADLPDARTLNQLLEYDAETGQLFWRKRDPSFFEEGNRSRVWKANNWNSVYADTEAFTCVDRKGYKVGTIFGVRHAAHRVIWKMIHGDDADQIDHVNHDTSDNRLSNLRNVTCGENRKNTTLYASNTSGHAGVYLCKATGRWKTQISVKGKIKALGRYVEISDAIAARKEAEKRFGFHENHGNEKWQRQRLTTGQ